MFLALHRLLLAARHEKLLFLPDACPKKFAIFSSTDISLYFFDAACRNGYREAHTLPNPPWPRTQSEPSGRRHTEMSSDVSCQEWSSDLSKTSCTVSQVTSLSYCDPGVDLAPDPGALASWTSSSINLRQHHPISRPHETLLRFPQPKAFLACSPFLQFPQGRRLPLQRQGEASVKKENLLPDVRRPITSVRRLLPPVLPDCSRRLGSIRREAAYRPQLGHKVWNEPETMLFLCFSIGIMAEQPWPNSHSFSLKKNH